jgi:hypothetical protein
LTVIRAALKKRRGNGCGPPTAGGGGDFTRACVAELRAIGAELRRRGFDWRQVVRGALSELSGCDTVTAEELEARIRGAVTRDYGADLGRRSWPIYGSLPMLVLIWAHLNAQTLEARRIAEDRQAADDRRLAEMTHELAKGSDDYCRAVNAEWLRQQGERLRNPDPILFWNGLTEAEQAQANAIYRAYGNCHAMLPGFRDFLARQAGAAAATRDRVALDALYYIHGCFPGESGGSKMADAPAASD